MKKLFLFWGMLFLFTFITPKESISAPSSTPDQPYITYNLPAPLPGSVEPCAIYTLPVPLPGPAEPCETYILYCSDGIGHYITVCNPDDLCNWRSIFCGTCM